MRFISIELNGFKRLGFGKIKSFILKPNHFCQLILGINGFGKSTLLKEISPLPGNKNDYYPGGSKTVVIEHNSKRYTLTTSYKNGVKCSFIDDSNNELNPSGTQAIQISLAYNIFGYTSDIHQLLHSKESFTDMSPKRRREWFIEVSNINYDYAISVYNRLKEESRDSVSSLKEHKKRLAQELASIMSKEEISLVDQEISSLESSIDDYISLIDRPSTPVSSSDMDVLLSKIVSTTSTIRSNIKEVHRDISRLNIDVSQLDSTIEDYKRDTTRLEYQVDTLVKELDSIRVEYQKSLGIDKLDRDTIQKEIDEISLVLKEEVVDKSNISKDELIPLKTRLLHWLSLRPAIISSDVKEFNLLSNQLFQDENKLSSLKETLANIRAETRLMMDKKHQHLVTCPKCSHEFIPGYDPDKIEESISKGKQLRAEHDALETNVIALRDKVSTLKESLEWLESFRKIKSIFSRYDYLLSNIDIDHPELILDIIDNEISLVDKYQQHLTLSKRHNELLSLLNTIKDKTISSSDYEKIIKEKEEYYSTIRNEFNQSRNKLNSLLKLKDNISTLERNKYTLSKDISILDDYQIEYIKSITLKRIESIISELKIKLGNKLKIKSDMDNKQSILDYIEKEINKLEERSSLLKIALDELSPESGMIAEGLFEFIKVFLSLMNQVIESIWSYPLTIHLDTSHDDLDLDFKFPMQVGLNDEYIDDVSLGSSGIKEVINLAFKLTALKALHLEDYPLFLDEFGASFDINHQVNATNIIKSIIDEHIHSQLFLVSHYESSYGGLSLANVDVVLLSKEIETPFTRVNTNVVME